MILICLAAVASPASAAATVKRVVYHGLRLEVPSTWPVVRLARTPHACVRFDVHAVYLGAPGAVQDCPAAPAGRTEAILISPLAAGGLAAAQRALPVGTATQAAVQLVEARQGVVVSATWANDPRTIGRALGIGDLGLLARRSRLRPPAASAVRFHIAGRRARAVDGAPATPGGIYTGSGFDACSTPSASTMSAWSASPYRALGVYIGGANMACSQPNLTAAWVSQESAAGWHLAPIYVGLQAPGNGCGCAAIAAGQAAAEGAAAASDAIAQAQARGIGPGNPIYFDMEGYTRSSSTSAAVLAFLGAWTQGLHGSGYLSGVYSSTGSGIADLVAQWGTGYPEPDELWVASWNGSQTTSDPSVPATEWSDHQRVHQYEGGHNETWGGVRINIDSDYLDAATAAAGSAGPPTPAGAPALAGAPLVGQTLTESHARWSAGTGGVSAYTYQWEDCTQDQSACNPIPGATGASYVVAASDAGQAVRVLEYATGAGGTGGPATSAPTAPVQATPSSGYWLSSAYGNVFNSPGAGFFGSPARHMHTPLIAGLAPTRDGGGYWLAEPGGTVLSYGDAARVRPLRPPGAVVGIAGDPGSRGFWAFTASGNVIAAGGARFRGSPAHSHVRLSNFVAMAATIDGRGYWLTTSTGRVYAFGDARRIYGIRSTHPIRGIVAAPGGGAWLFTTYGNVYNLGGSPFFGSAARAGSASVTGMAATADRQGYWLATASGTVLPFGDAASWKLRRPPHPVTGIAAG